MGIDLDNWKTQVRKGYLELCILLIIRKHGRIYGFDLLEKLKDIEMPVKEGTLYPMLNRMTEDAALKAVWETTNVKGHPRKFYSLTNQGTELLSAMQHEFSDMVDIFQSLNTKGEVQLVSERPTRELPSEPR